MDYQLVFTPRVPCRCLSFLTLIVGGNSKGESPGGVEGVEGLGMEEEGRELL